MGSSPTSGTKLISIPALSKITSILLLLSGIYKLATSTADIFHIQNLQITPSAYQSLVKKLIILLATSVLEASYALTLLFKSPQATKIAHLLGGILLLLISLSLSFFNPMPQLP